MRRIRSPRDVGDAIDAVRKLPTYARLVWGLARDPRVPLSSKAILAGIVGYLVLPLDLVPDFLPVLGQLDDLAVVLLGLDLFIQSAPKAVIDEHMARVHRGGDDLVRDAEQVRALLGERYGKLREDLVQILDRQRRRFRSDDEAATELERWQRSHDKGRN